MSESALLGNTAFRAGHRSFDWNGETMKATDCPEVEALLRLSPKSFMPEKPLSGESVKEWKVKE